MGKYSNVNYRSLLNAASTALSEINRYSLSEDINSLNSASVLETSVKDKILDALRDIASSKSLTGSISELKERLNILKRAADNIGSYQNIEREIESLKSRRFNFDGTINQSVEREIRNKTASLNRYETMIDGLLR